MNFSLKRQEYNSWGIVGLLTSEDNSLVLATLEHAFLQTDGSYLPKLAAGTYICSYYFSPDHQYYVYEVQNVPNFMGQSVSFIELHIGCYNRDSDGCILLGEELSELCQMIINSKEAFGKFMALQNAIQSFTLEVS